MFWTYILTCADGTFYTGHTDNLEKRLADHNFGDHHGYTFSRRPVALAWSQDFPTRAEALAAEFQIKPWNRKKKQALIAGEWQLVSDAAKKQFK